MDAIYYYTSNGVCTFQFSQCPAQLVFSAQNKAYFEVKAQIGGQGRGLLLRSRQMHFWCGTASAGRSFGGGCVLLRSRSTRAPAPVDGTASSCLSIAGVPPQHLQPRCPVSDQDSMAQAQANKENVSPSWLPQIGMKFRNLDDAWSFWVNYGGHVGFEVRKRYTNECKYDGKATSSRYVCAKEGGRARDKRDHAIKNPRAETRTCCPVRMGLTLNRVEGNYEVFDLILEHNHVLYLPQTFHLMSSQRKISEVQAFEIEAADDSGIRPKAAHELSCRQVGPMNLSYTCYA
uniref:FAR1 domain-containing protein n=1 Tax=Setaria italica TaxID=4555 RepID=K3Z018_SETIT